MIFGYFLKVLFTFISFRNDVLKFALDIFSRSTNFVEFWEGFSQYSNLASWVLKTFVVTKLNKIYSSVFSSAFGIELYFFKALSLLTKWFVRFILKGKFFISLLALRWFEITDVIWS